MRTSGHQGTVRRHLHLTDALIDSSTCRHCRHLVQRQAHHAHLALFSGHLRARQSNLLLRRYGLALNLPNELPRVLASDVSLKGISSATYLLKCLVRNSHGGSRDTPVLSVCASGVVGSALNNKRLRDNTGWMRGSPPLVAMILRSGVDMLSRSPSADSRTF